MQFIITTALRRPLTVMVLVLAVALGSFLAVGRSVFEQLGWPYPEGLPRGMEVDIFPSLNLPVIYVCQPYGGMDPAQMEGFLTNYYEYHFLYISGIHHVESRNVQGTALMKLYFHPGTNMSQAMAETINYVNRSQAFMPPGTVSPFVMRFDTGSVPVGYLVLSSETRTIAEIQDIALFRVRPMFAALPGVSAPPPFGGSARSIVITVDPQRLQAYGMSPDEVVKAVTAGNTISPSGNLLVGDKYPIVSTNSVVKDPQQLLTIPIRTGPDPVYIRDVGKVTDAADAPAGYALADGRRAVYILATKRADASTMSVINNIKKAIPEMQAVLPPDIKVSFEFDQSPYVTRAVESVVVEAMLGAILVGLAVLFFLRDWRSALVVVLNIPLAICFSILALWLIGETINVMTLGGLALAIGILVDEATVEVENIHAQMEHTDNVSLAVRRGNAQTAVPRLLAMLCILAVFIPAFFMQGAAQGLFAPLAMAVGFAMIGSYILSSTFVPVISVWLLRHFHNEEHDASLFGRFRKQYERVLTRLVRVRWLVVSGYLLLAAIIIVWRGPRLGREIFPVVDAGQFRLRMRAPDGTHIARTEKYALGMLDLVKEEVGEQNVALTLGYVGMIHSNFPVNAVYQWSRGPEEAILYVELKEQSGIRVEELKERLRQRVAQEMPDLRVSFEPSDIVNEVMSFGSPTPIEIAISGPNLAESRAHAEKIRAELAKIKPLRDIQFGQSMDYPTIDVQIDREKAGLSGMTQSDISRALTMATSSSRFVVPNYWADPKSGIAYQVQVEVPRPVLRSPDEGVQTIKSAEDLSQLPIRKTADGQVLVRDVATLQPGSMPGQYDRYNMRRQVTLTANIYDQDLGEIASQVQAAIKRAGDPPQGVKIEVRGQIVPMKEMMSGLTVGLAVAILVVFLVLMANFQSIRLALVTVSTVPAVIAGVLLMLSITGTTLNIQSFVGAIMAIGVAMANAILLVTFSEETRRTGKAANDAAVTGAASRLRAVLMTSSAMIAGMLPMALGLGEAGQQNAPLGRAVIGGLTAATVATLFILPSVFAIIQKRAGSNSASLDPTDPQSAHFTSSADSSLGGLET
ncbi:MAG: efflux RND transporter permease subunit [Planctomycetota bacterium]|nr:efflux RND transporter permease subunit [Planctomycetota bacterium]